MRGPNVMLGYLRVENPGVLEPPENGWHDTGDIVTIDAQGFVTIKGRAKRFAKIGGEMVSLAAVEALAGGALAERAVGGRRPCPIRARASASFWSRSNRTRRARIFQAYAKSKGASDLMIPAEIMIVKLPLLGSGKVEYHGRGSAGAGAVPPGGNDRARHRMSGR